MSSSTTCELLQQQQATLVETHIAQKWTVVAGFPQDIKLNMGNALIFAHSTRPFRPS